MVVIVGDHDVTEDDGEKRVEVCGKLEHPDYDRYIKYRMQSCSVSHSHSLVSPQTMILLSSPSVSLSPSNMRYGLYAYQRCQALTMTLSWLLCQAGEPWLQVEALLTV